MKKLNLCAVSMSAALISAAVPLSFQWSPAELLSLSLDQAEARVGRPRTATSVAGVSRRVHRRTYRRAAVGTAAVGAAAVGTAGIGAYSGYSYPGYSYSGYYPDYSYSGYSYPGYSYSGYYPDYSYSGYSYPGFGVAARPAYRVAGRAAIRRAR
jgi:hypothetical protein